MADSDNVFASMQQNGTHIISFNIALTDMEDRERGLLQICDMMRKDLANYPIIRTFQVIAGGQNGGMGGQASAEIEIYGYDFAATDKVAQEITNRLKSYEKIDEVITSREEYSPEYQVDFDREKLSVNGINTATAAQYLRNRINGAIASYYREDGEEYDIKVRYAPEHRQSVEDIENIMIYNSQGKGIRIRDLGEVKEIMTPPTIERKDRERMVKVTAVCPADMALSDMIAIVNKEMEEIDMPGDITWDLGGTYEEQQESFADLITLMLLVVILVFIVMAAQFESLTYPFVIMFSIPFALVGVLLGLVVTGTPMGIMAMVGLLMLLGIVVKNGIVLIDYTILCRERGMGILQSVVTAGKSRLRPVLMTTLTTVLGMVPMAVGTGTGSEMWRSMGLTVAWGLSVSTLITLVIVPILYAIFAGVGVKKNRRKLAKLYAKNA
jgi:HAE1 family hydrophobic/amphiphilic exporter-1